MRRFALASIVCVVACSIGCLGRTGIGGTELDSLDDEDAAVDSGLSLADATPDTSTPPPDTFDAGRDSFIDIWEVFPIPDSGPIGACASCVRDKCGTQVNACVNDPVCRAGLACTATSCLGGGGPGGFDLACVAKCFGGDLSKAFQAINTFTCVISGCGTACGGLLGGLGGGFPGGGGGDAGGSGSGGSGSGSAGAGGKFSFTPEEMSRLPMSTRFQFSPEAFAPWRDELFKSACEQGLATCAP